MCAFDNLPSFAGYSRIDDYRLASLSLSVTRSRAGEQLSWLGLIDLVSWNCEKCENFCRIFFKNSISAVFNDRILRISHPFISLIAKFI